MDNLSEETKKKGKSKWQSLFPLESSGNTFFLWLFYLATGFVLVSFFIVFSNVIARYVFNRPFYWAEEVTSLIIILLGFFPAAELWRRRGRGGHIELDFFSQKIARSFPRFFKSVETIISFVGLIFTGVLIWQSFNTSVMAYVQKMEEPTLLGTPLWIPYSAMLLGSVALFLAFLITFLKLIMPGRK